MLMKKSENVQGMMSMGQALELGGAVLKALPRDIPPSEAQQLIGNAESLKRKMRLALMPAETNEIKTHVELREEWQDFYMNHFSLPLNLSNVHIHEKPDGKWRLLIVVNLSAEFIFDKFNTPSNFFSSIYRPFRFDLERDPQDGAYSVWVRNVKEADHELKDFPHTLHAKSIATETLHERLIHELKHFDDTGEHLDEERSTICFGSKCGRFYPVVSSRNGRIEIEGISSLHARGYYREVY